MSPHVNSAVAIALEGDNNGAKVLKAAVHDKRKALRARFETYDNVNRIINKKAVVALSDHLHLVARGTEEQYRMEKIEHPHPIWKEMWVTVAIHAVGAFWPIQLLFQDDMEEWGFKGKCQPEIFLGSFRGIVTAQSAGVLQSRQLLGLRPPTQGEPILVRGMSLDTTSTAVPMVLRANYNMAAQTLEQTLAELSDKGLLSLPNITVALHGVLSKNMWDAWLNLAVGDLLETALPDVISEDDEILVMIPNTYQEFMLGRIEAHADRVESYHLAAAKLVSQDLRSTMADVWMSMPPDFAKPVSTNA
ncbi:hypothetical protein FRC07_002596 [Ceratobasidium sp. 392]|nr:hypothetical protein FRC07_002596 [Ceratobasidium sp. 392]